jgi:transcriptional regulator with XRE-family HTH domain
MAPMTTDDSTLGLFLREFLERDGMSVSAFGEAVGLSRAVAYRLWSGKAVQLSGETLVAMSDVLGLSLHDLTLLWAGKVSQPSSDTAGEMAMRRLVKSPSFARLTPEQMRDVFKVAEATVEALARPQESAPDEA